MPATIHQTHIIEEAPDVALKGGLFYVTDKLENGGTIIRVFRPTTLFKTIAALAERSREYRLGGAEIVQFPDLIGRLGAS